jgi:hypothetical protein
MIAAITPGTALVYGVAAFVILCAIAAISLVAGLFIIACAKLSEIKASKVEKPNVWQDRGVRR